MTDRVPQGQTAWKPSILEILDSIGLAEKLHERKHVKMYGPTIPTALGPILGFDLRKLIKTKFPYIMWMPQEVFLEFLAQEAKQFPSFRLVMGANVQRLLEDHPNPTPAKRGRGGARRALSGRRRLA